MEAKIIRIPTRSVITRFAVLTKIAGRVMMLPDIVPTWHTPLAAEVHGIRKEDDAPPETRYVTMNGNAIPSTTAIIAVSIFCIAVPSAMTEQVRATYNERADDRLSRELEPFWSKSTAAYHRPQEERYPEDCCSSHRNEVHQRGDAVAVPKSKVVVPPQTFVKTTLVSCPVAGNVTE